MLVPESLRHHRTMTLLAALGATLLAALPCRAQVQAELDAKASASGSLSVELGGTRPEPSGGKLDATVLDLCQVPAPTTGGVGHAKERAVIFDLDGEAITDGPEYEFNEKGEMVREHRVFQSVQMHNHLRNVFFSNFPLKRHHSVMTTLHAPEKLYSQQVVSPAEMIRAAALDPFAAYSIACADWVILPRVAKKTAGWGRVKKKKMVGRNTVTYWAWDLSLTVDLAITTFHFENGQWVSKGSVTANGNLLSLAVSTSESGEVVNAMVRGGHHGHGPRLSATPDPTCTVPLVDDVKDVADAFGKCGAATTNVTKAASQMLQSGAADKNDKVAEAATTPGDGAGQGLAATELRALAVASAGNPKRVALDLALKAGGSASASLGETASAAQGLVATCNSSVDAVVKVSDRLRQMSSNPIGEAQHAALGFASCAGIPLTFDLGDATPPGTSQSRSAYCFNVDDDTSRGAAAMRDVALCTGRVTGERSTISVRVDSVNRWWRIHVPLLACSGRARSNAYCMAIGQTEGIERGDQFIAVDRHGSSLGFGRIYRQGRGGGETDPADTSEFRFRTSDAPTGSGMVERATAGVLLGAQPRFGMLLRRGDLASKQLFGGAFEAAYNGGKFVGLGDEFWIRTNIAYMTHSDETFFAIEALPEAQYYLFNRVAAYLQSGASFGLIYKSIGSGATKEDLSGLSVMAHLGTGLDLALSPAWSLRAGATGGQSLIKTKLENKAKTLTLNAGYITQVHAEAAVNYNF